MIAVLLVLSSSSAWAGKAEDVRWCQEHNRTPVAVARCFNAVEAHYWRAGRSPVSVGLLQKIQSARLALAKRFQDGELTASQYSVEMNRVYDLVESEAANRYLSIYAAPQSPICYTSTGPLGLMTFCD